MLVVMAEQLAVCVHYVPPEGEIKASFHCLKKVGRYDAEAVINAVEHVRISNNTDAQTYNSTAIMSKPV